MQMRANMKSLFLSLGGAALALLVIRTLFLASATGCTAAVQLCQQEKGNNLSSRTLKSIHISQSKRPMQHVVYLEKGHMDGVNLRSILMNLTPEERQQWIVLNLPNFQTLRSDEKSRAFAHRVAEFFQESGGQGFVSSSTEERELEDHLDFVIDEGKDPDTGEEFELLRPMDLELVRSTSLTSEIEGAVLGEESIGGHEKKYQCEVRVFMIWISPVSRFGPRELLSLESLFKTHPLACLVILSRSLDSEEGNEVLQPFLHRNLRVLAVTPDIPRLLEGTPAYCWFDRVKKGEVDPGHISFSQNLSNLLRLVALYKYGGLYIDNDIVVLKSLSTLQNVIGSQSDNDQGHWTRLNNAVMKFTKGHPVLYKCIQEFALTFNGNRWGHNGPYLVSRVLSRLQTNRTTAVQTEDWHVDILPPSAFYPADWHQIRDFLAGPHTQAEKLRLVEKTEELEESSYTLHLWNKETRGSAVQSGSILDSVFRHRCIFCNETTLQAALEPQMSNTKVHT